MLENLTKVLRLAEQLCAVHRSGKRVRPAMWAALESHLRAARAQLDAAAAAREN
jgi:hypothetical protein